VRKRIQEVVIVGGGLAGLSAAIYLSRAQRDVLVVDSRKSMARWEPDVENYLGFPKGVSGSDLLTRGRQQARQFNAKFARDEIIDAKRAGGLFVLTGGKKEYAAKRLLVATGIFHLPPEIEGVKECVGSSIFFCKDCDGRRVIGQQIVIYGTSNEAAEYALAMLLYSAQVRIATNGKKPAWDKAHALWIQEYQIPVIEQAITTVRRKGKQISELLFCDESSVPVQALFTTRGDIYYNELARKLGAQTDAAGEIKVDHRLQTTVPGLFAAGCVTPANCQMIIAAGQGAIAAQAINRDLFEESLATHSLRHFVGGPLRTKKRKSSLASAQDQGLPNDPCGK
jgi:thioredoxin reductase (NADPH)